MFKRPVYRVLKKRLLQPRRFIQVLSGPRQSGKSTIARQIMRDLQMPSHYATADEPTLKDSHWIEQQWEAARLKVRLGGRKRKTLLILDEIQKITGWSEVVKLLWDQDSAAKLPLHVVVLGSSPLLVQRGLSDSLAGRFETIPVTHWSFAEMRKAFGWHLADYILYGGYPGAAPLIEEYQRWTHYIRESLIETTISRDILLMTRIDKPALLRRLFHLGCNYSGQVLSYQKMLGQLQDAGNTTTLARYLDFLRSSGQIVGLSKYAGQQVRRRASSPKLLVLNTALMTATAAIAAPEIKKDPDRWGRWVESTVGAYLANRIIGRNLELFYWTARNREVDFVLCRGQELVAIEVKSSRKRASFSGMQAFSKQFSVKKKLLVGAQGIPLEEFLLTPPEVLFD